MDIVNGVKIENNFEAGSFNLLNPSSWFGRRLTKDTVNILFIDDQYFPIVDNLAKAGYRVKRLKDVKDVDSPDLQIHDIIFVDYDGVGRNFSETHQGAQLVKEIKDKYGAAKFVVLYTEQSSIPTETTMSDLFKAADGHMRKSTSEASDFIKKIEEALTKIKQ